MMAGPPSRPHRGHTSPPEVPVPCPRRVQVGPGPNRAVGPWHRCLEQDRALPARGHGGGRCCPEPWGAVRGAPPARGAASSEPQFPGSSSISDGPSMAVCANQAVLGKESQRWVPGMGSPARRTIMQMGSLGRAEPF